MALGFLSAQAMSSEAERVLSQAKHTISDARCRLGAAIIEATECDRRWMRVGLGTTIRALSSYLTEHGIKEGMLWGPQGRPQGILDP
jgi:hypothetical protein